MRWRDFYSEGICLCNPEGKDLFSLIAIGGSYPVKFVVQGMNDPAFYIVIGSIVADRKSHDIHMTVRTQGALPAGVRHGIYELTFTNLGFSKDLPADMFEDE